MKNRVVVLGCAGYGTLGLIRSLGEGGYQSECYCYGKHCEDLLASKYVDKGTVFNSLEETIDFLIHNYPCSQGKPFLFTIPDPPAYYVDIHLNQLKQKFILMSAGEQGMIAYWMDKRNQANMARKHGLTIPWTIQLSKNDKIPESIEYPVFTKSIKSADGGKCDESICWNKEELENKKLTIASETFLVMKYIRKKQEICYFGMSIKGKVYIDFYDELSRFPNGAYGYYGVYKRCQHDDTYFKCISMMEEIGYDGLFDIEFLLGDDGIFYFMEVNFRVDAAIYKLAEGVNLPVEWCRLACMAKEDLPETLPIASDHFTGMSEVYDFKTSVLTGQVNPLKWFWEFCTADRHMWVNLKDPKPFFIWMYGFIKRIRLRGCPQ